MTQDVGFEAEDLAPGDRVADYEVLEPIGRGGMAVVYRALDLRLGRQVALKVLAPHLVEDEAFRHRFIRESRAAAGVEHPHIIPVFDAGQAGGMLFIAMRYVGLGDVRRLLEREGTLTPARAAAIAAQVGSALDAAHAHGLVHRDVKPGNLLLAEPDGSGADHVYLSDFGLSKHSLATTTLTATGQFLGTLDYVSPEQIQGQPVDGRADQYALACTVVEMLSGTPPFRRDKTVELMWAQLEEPPPSLSERRPDLPPALDAVLRTALAKSPRSRFPTCGEFAVALQAACELSAPARGRSEPVEEQLMIAADPRRAPVTSQDDIPEGTRPPEARHGPPPHSHRGRRRGRNAILIGLVALAGLAVLAGIGYKLFDHRTTGTGSTAGVHAGPASTVLAYFDAINSHNFAKAWRLENKPESLTTFEAGYRGTAHDTVTILHTTGDVVTARLVATQTDGTTKRYQGTYTVTNGVITSADVRQRS